VRRHRSVRGYLVGVIALALVLGGVGFAVLRVATAVDTAIGSRASPHASAPIAPLGKPVTVDYGGGRFEVTVFGAIAQPGQSWSLAYRGDKPQLVVDAELHRIDSGTGTIRVLGWDWSVATKSGTPSGSPSDTPPPTASWPRSRVDTC